MRFTALLILVAATFLAGCGSVRNVQTGDQAAIEASRVNRAASGKLARVKLQDGEKVYGVGVRVTPDSTSWVDPQSASYVTVGTDQVNSITLVRAGQGALVGLGVGIVTGVASGILRAQLEGDDPVDQFPSQSTGQKMTTLPLAHSAYASLVTTALGAIVGRKNTFRLMRQ